MDTWTNVPSVNFEAYPELADGSYLYSGFTHTLSGSILYRSTDDGWGWSAISPMTGSTTNVSGLPAYARFGGDIYVGTKDTSFGCEIWRSATGDSSSWSPVVQGGMGGDPNNEKILSFSIPGDGYIYASTFNEATGTEIWRSSTGDSGTWEQVNTNGFGSSLNAGSWLTRNLQTPAVSPYERGSSAVEYLYAGSSNTAGASLYRVDLGTQDDDPISTEEDNPADEGGVEIEGPAAGKGIANPDRGDTVTIHFRGSQDGTYTLRIFTILGEEVYKATTTSLASGNFTWIPGDLASGVYIAHVKGPGVDEQKKIAILR
jgi:hypothetical protein